MALWTPWTRKADLVALKSFRMMEANETRKAFLFQNQDPTANAFIDWRDNQGVTIGAKVPPGQSFADPGSDGVCPHMGEVWVTVDTALAPVTNAGGGINWTEKV